MSEEGRRGRKGAEVRVVARQDVYIIWESQGGEKQQQATDGTEQS